jgi:U4/U6 small nuclear ribonucleoprotein PRP4
MTPSSEAQTEAYATPGPPELKDARLKLVKSSLDLTKQRLAERSVLAEHMEQHWEKHEKGNLFFVLYSPLPAFLEIEHSLSSYSESSSTIGDSRPLSSCSYNFDGTQIVTASWTGDLKVWDISTCTCTKKLIGHTERTQTALFHPREQPPRYVFLL